MRVIPPIDITDAKLVSSSVPETDYAEWDSGTTYALGDRVILTSTHKVYESVQAGNTNHSPTAETTEIPVWWLEIGYTNRWRMFDLYRNTQTTGDTYIEVQVALGERVDSIALATLAGDTATITMVSDNVTVYQKVLPLTIRQTSTWYNYFFESFGVVPSIAVFDLPPFTNATITVRIDGVNGAACGSIVFGKSEYLGRVELQAVSDALNFSVVERDAFGNSTLVPRKSIPKTNQTLLANKETTNKLILLRNDLNAKPAVWSGLDDATDGYFNALLILGYYRQFLISLEYPQHTLVQLELEEI